MTSLTPEKWGIFKDVLWSSNYETLTREVEESFSVPKETCFRKWTSELAYQFYDIKMHKQKASCLATSKDRTLLEQMGYPLLLEEGLLEE
ncbi:hypothetical protein AVEN_260009-1 [Araneus ventricosus]|uniref:Uncharacterized protein n=1 Tax=Araneus ventricosus TaxID=182803 RepID=A0A4Y2H6A2_ARAVE|nr:hypothetical protein AVEN_260009-1 [Araneus ventricosus]